MTHLLDLTSTRTRGRATAKVTAEIVRELTPADLALLQVERQTKAKPLQRLRDSHHRVARCFAAGMRAQQVSMQTGYSLSRLSILAADKSFQDLIEVYRKAGEEAYTEYSDLAMENMIRGERIIADSLEAAGDTAEPLPLGELRPVLDIVADRADRFGYPRKTTAVNVNVDFAGKLESARRRSGLIDVIPTPPAGEAAVSAVAAPPKEPVA